MAKKEQLYQKGSYVDYAVIGFLKILKLSKSSKISDKLVGFNTLIFVFTLANCLVVKNLSNDALSNGFMYLLMLLFSFIGSNIYAPILDVLSNFAINKINSLKISLIPLLLAFLLSSIGLLFRFEVLAGVTLIILLIQLIIIGLGTIFNYLNYSIADIKINFKSFLGVLGIIKSIVVIISGILTIIFFFI